MSWKSHLGPCVSSIGSIGHRLCVVCTVCTLALTRVPHRTSLQFEGKTVYKWCVSEWVL